MEFVETRTKVHRLNEGYAHIPKMRDFTKDLKDEILEIKDFRLRRLPIRSTALQEVDIFPTWFIFSLRDVLRYDCCVDTLRGCLDCVKTTLNGCFKARLWPAL